MAHYQFAGGGICCNMHKFLARRQAGMGYVSFVFLFLSCVFVLPPTTLVISVHAHEKIASGSYLNDRPSSSTCFNTFLFRYHIE